MGRTTPAGGGAADDGRTGPRLTGGVPDVSAVLREFIEHDYVRVVAAVGLITHDRDQAEDAVQDAMVRLLTERGPDDDTPVATWITTTASTTDREEAPGSAEELVGPSGAAPGADGSEVEADPVVAVVQSLPLEQRQVAVMRYYLDAPVIDIATGMGVPHEQVVADLRAVDAKVEAALGGDDQTPTDPEQERAS
mgnify:CR=1 FL=1